MLMPLQVIFNWKIVSDQENTPGPFIDRMLSNSEDEIRNQKDDFNFLFEFELNFNVCNTCGQDTEKTLICCSSCPRCYHLGCVKLLRIPKGIWRCPICESRDNKCTICDCELSLSTEHRLVRCMSCGCFMHFDCVEVALKLILRTPKYFYSKQIVMDKENSVYDYICYDCQRALGAERILDSYNFEEHTGNPLPSNTYYLIKIGRASCRERVSPPV